MKIVLLNDKYGQIGASSFLVHQTSNALQNRGHIVHVITSHREEDDSKIIYKDNIISLPISYRISLRHYLSLRNRRVSSMLFAELKKLEPNIVHAHNIHTYLTYDALRVANKTGAKVFISTHDVMSFAYGRLNTDKFLNSKGKNCSLTVLDQFRNARLQYNPLRNIVIRKYLKYADIVLPVSKSLENALHQNHIMHTQVIWNAINMNIEKNTPRNQENFRDQYDLSNRKIILFAGRVSADKGAYQLLAALEEIRKKVPEVLLLIAGRKDAWEALISEKNIHSDLKNHYLCTGWLNHANMINAYKASDVITTPSLCLDTFNMTNLEAMAASKPVVGTIFGGTPEVVEHNVTGYICDPRNTKTYANYLLDLLQNPKRAKAMGEAGRKRAEKKFDLHHQIDEIEKLYTS